MFEIAVEKTFSAAHAIRIRGSLETLHGHDWRVRATVAADDLDDDGLVCDFDDLAEILDRIIAPFRNRTLNDVAPFDERNPTAEEVARWIGDSLATSVPPDARRRVRLTSVTVSEAPGCIATYRTE